MKKISLRKFNKEFNESYDKFVYQLNQLDLKYQEFVFKRGIPYMSVLFDYFCAGGDIEIRIKFDYK